MNKVGRYLVSRYIPTKFDRDPKIISHERVLGDAVVRRTDYNKSKAVYPH